MAEPRTEAGRHYVATMFGRERSDVFDVTQTEAKMSAAIRRIEDDAVAEYRRELAEKVRVEIDDAPGLDSPGGYEGSMIGRAYIEGRILRLIEDDGRG